MCVRVVNLLKARPLNSRLFAELCSDEDHQTLLLHTEVRWLSRGRILCRVFELRVRILEFRRQIDSEYYLYFEMIPFIIRLPYLSDIFYHDNNINRKLQGRGITMITCQQVMNIALDYSRSGVGTNPVHNSDYRYNSAISNYLPF